MYPAGVRIDRHFDELIVFIQCGAGHVGQAATGAVFFIGRQVTHLRDDGQVRAWGATMAATPGLLTALAPATRAFNALRLARPAFFALLTEHPALKILDLGLVVLNDVSLLGELSI